MKCINKSHPDYIALLDNNPYPIPLLDAKISIWQDQNDTDEFPSLEQLAQPIGDSKIRYAFKTSTAIINKLDKVKQWYKSLGNTDKFWNKVQQDLQIPKEQVVLVKESEGNTIEEKLLDFSANYSYTIEINTAKEQMSDIKLQELSRNREFQFGNFKYFSDNEGYWKFDNTEESLNNREITRISLSDYTKAYRSSIETNPTQHYSNLTVPGGTNYTENEIATPGITPSIKGHAQFATSNGIGWFRSDDKHPFTGFLEDLISSGTIKKVPCG